MCHHCLVQSTTDVEFSADNGSPCQGIGLTVTLSENQELPLVQLDIPAYAECLLLSVYRKEEGTELYRQCYFFHHNLSFNSLSIG